MTAPLRQHLAMPTADTTRRAFLQRATALAATGTAAPLAMNLSLLGEAAAFSATDYKALVCVFLYGGNDHANTVVHADATRHARYATIRGSLAVARDSLNATLLNPAQALPGGQLFALHPSMPELASLFNGGRAAVLFNVGPLIAPLTKSQFFSGDQDRFPSPPKLFSHNDQASVWQASGPEGSTQGWGGRLGDLALAGNGGSLFTCISAAGSGVFLSGAQSLRYQVSTGGAVPMAPLNSVFGFTGMAGVLRELTTESRAHVLENEYNRVVARSAAAERSVSAALGNVTLATPFPEGNSLASELRIVARLIAARQALGVKRQVFLVSLGGFDHHDRLLTAHPGLLRQLSQAMSAFYAATVDMGVAEQVTTFTGSDFGRALTSNGDGTDHGWGGHQFVMGGAVRGKAFYGVPPAPSIGDTGAPDDQWHVGQGRLLPTTSVDQLAATLGHWFGANDSELNLVLPNLRYFGGAQAGVSYPVDLGMLRA
jgi:uncharacterized protein (DUF1501 family)